MDITGYISDLLFDHDCVIIPGFGGFICSYKPAQIDEEQNTISPPSKALSFNSALQTNEGLLTNYIASANNISFIEANELISIWVSSAKILLNEDGYLDLKDIGKFAKQADASLDFQPSETINYLKSSYGLRTISAVPVEHKETVLENESIAEAKPNRVLAIRNLRIAAMILLLIGISFLAGMMWMGYDINALNLNEAGVFSFIQHAFKTGIPEMKTLPVESSGATLVTGAHEDKQELAMNDSISSAVSIKSKATISETELYDKQPKPGVYYVIIGVFKEEKNVEAAKTRLFEKHAGSRILIESGNTLTRIGYEVGNDYKEAKAELLGARAENQDYWLLHKQ